MLLDCVVCDALRYAVLHCVCLCICSGGRHKAVAGKKAEESEDWWVLLLFSSK